MQRKTGNQKEIVHFQLKQSSLKQTSKENKQNVERLQEQILSESQDTNTVAISAIRLERK